MNKKIHTLGERQLEQINAGYAQGPGGASVLAKLIAALVKKIKLLVKCREGGGSETG